MVSDLMACIPLNFSNVSNIKQFNGSYVPSNDYVMLASGLLVSNTFNFIIALCDSQLDLTLSFQKSGFSLALQKFAFQAWALDPLNFVSSIFIDGRTSPNPGNTPMPQGVAVNYSIITGQGTVS